MVYLSGGLAHQDTFDLKPDAPAEVRGEFKPIATNVPGVQIGELLPQLAQCMDKLAVIRSLVGQRDEHCSWQSYDRHDDGRGQARGQAALRHRRRRGCRARPTRSCRRSSICSRRCSTSRTTRPAPANLGRAAAPVKVDGDELAVMKNLAVTPDQLRDRKALLDSIDALPQGRRQPTHPADTFHDRAFDVLTSSKLVEALDVTKEPERTSATATAGARPSTSATAAPMWNDQLLMARRLVEAGLPRGHRRLRLLGHARQQLPAPEGAPAAVRQGISALVEDIYARGLERRRDGVRLGRVRPHAEDQQGRRPRPLGAGELGAAGRRRHEGGPGDRLHRQRRGRGEGRPDPLPDVLATVYHNLGIDPHAMVYDVSNRPSPILPGGVTPIEKVY